MLLYIQQTAGHHSDSYSLTYDALAAQGIFWAVIRHRVQISRLPRHGETIRVETWPMPATRSSFPRSVIAYDEKGEECFRAISLWVLMDIDKRSMILPGKSGVTLDGSVRGNELAPPGSIVPREFLNSRQRTVSYSDLDRNGHMNTTRYLDWVDDLLPSAFHRNHTVREFTVCYLSEAREGDALNMQWDFLEDGLVQVDGHRSEADQTSRVFSAKFLYE